MSDAQELLKNLNSDDLTEKKKSIFKIGDLKVKEAIPTLIQLLETDSDSVVRNSSARALGKIADPEQFDIILEALDKALNDPDSYVKANACWSLGKLKDKRAIPSLMKMVDPNQRSYAMVGDPKAQTNTKENEASIKLKEEGIKFSDIIVSAVKAIGNIKDPAGVPALMKGLEDEADGTVRCASAIALGKIGDPSAVLPLIERLKIDKYWYVRRDIAKALAKLKDPRAAPELAKKTSDMYDEVREYSIKALLAIGKPVANILFKLYLADPKNQKLKKFITTQLTRDEILQILENLVKSEKNDSKRKIYQNYLDKIETQT